MILFVRGRLIAAQPLATKEPYGCGVPFTGAAHTAEVCFVSVGHGDSAVPLYDSSAQQTPQSFTLSP